MRRPSTYRAAKTGNPTITMEQMLVAFQQADNVRREAAYRKLTGASDQIQEPPLEDMEIVTRPQLAKLMKCSKANVDYHRRHGRLTPVYIPGSSRLRGFTAQSVRNLLRGGFSKEVA